MSRCKAFSAANSRWLLLSLRFLSEGDLCILTDDSFWRGHAWKRPAMSSSQIDFEAWSPPGFVSGLGISDRISAALYSIRVRPHSRPSLTSEIDGALDVAVLPYFSSLNLLSKSKGLPAELRIITHANSRAIVKKQLKWLTVSEHIQTRVHTILEIIAFTRLAHITVYVWQRDVFAFRMGRIRS